ncbi:MAG: ATP-binding protein [Alphaproteobacteria bacterium]|nr:ATP-binding protein [Alphaproteobacteria bacterium]
MTIDNQFAERIRDRLVEELTDVNEQLEQFAYVASHDLREPLRTIVCFTDLLEKEYADRLDDEGRRYMAINRQAAKKMEALVSNLLEFARLGQNAQRLEETDCNDILRQAKEALGESLRSTQAVIESDFLPTVRANPLRLCSLFQNLIGNAIKYQALGVVPLIRISAREQNDDWLFSLADNGIGIRSEYLNVIFSPFKRLHSDQEYVGTGIGLSLCKRIVESLGGNIWAESESGKGSVFYFTLPKRG